MKDIKQKAKKGIIWSTIADIAHQIIRVGSSIVLARILFPHDFGLIATAALATKFARQILNLGFPVVIVQREKISKDLIYTVFTTNIILHALISLALIGAASLIADFFDTPKLINIIPFFALNIMLKSVIGPYHALIQREFKFKELAKVSMVSAFFALLTPVILAIFGFGYWSLVFGPIVGSIMDILLVYRIIRFVPKIRFSWSVFKDIYSFGMWVSFSNYLNYFIKNIDYIIIGKFINITQLGFYERAFNIMEMPRRRLQHAINSVIFSAFSRMQHEKEKVITGTSNVLTLIGYIALPLFIWLAFAAPDLIIVMYGEKWKAIIIPLQIMCFSGVIQTIILAFDPILLALDLVKLKVWAQIIYFILLSSTILLLIDKGINGVAVAVSVSSFFNLVFLLFIVIRKLDTTFMKLFKPQGVILFYSVCMISGLIVYYLFLRLYIEFDFISLIIISFISIIFYFVPHFFVKSNELTSVVSDVFGKKIKKIRIWKIIYG